MPIFPKIVFSYEKANRLAEEAHQLQFVSAFLNVASLARIVFPEIRTLRWVRLNRCADLLDVEALDKLAHDIYSSAEYEEKLQAEGHGLAVPFVTNSDPIVFTLG